MEHGLLGTLMINKENNSNLMVTANLASNRTSFKSRARKKAKKVKVISKKMIKMILAVKTKN
jgi:hypothetical protein